MMNEKKDKIPEFVSSEAKKILSTLEEEVGKNSIDDLDVILNILCVSIFFFVTTHLPKCYHEELLKNINNSFKNNSKESKPFDEKNESFFGYDG